MCKNADKTELPGWEEALQVVQSQNTCIAATVEWALRYLEIPGVENVPLKQIERDLYKYMSDHADINSGRAKIYLEEKYGEWVQVEHNGFDDTEEGAEEKMSTLKLAISEKRVPIICISQDDKAECCHIIPVVRIDNSRIYYRDPIPAPDGYESHLISEIREWHKNRPGGKDLLIITRKTG